MEAGRREDGRREEGRGGKRERKGGKVREGQGRNEGGENKEEGAAHCVVYNPLFVSFVLFNWHQCLTRVKRQLVWGSFFKNGKFSFACLVRLSK